MSAKKQLESRRLSRNLHKIVSSSFPYTILSILVGFIAGGIALLIAGYNPLEAYASLFRAIFLNAKTGKLSTKSMTYSFIEYANPYILTGLSVAFSFKTGIFNIGAEGQYIVGSLAACLVAIFVKAPAWVLIPLCILASIAAGVLWGGIVGYLKVRFGSHEVLCMIMFNWIAFYLSNVCVNLERVNGGGGKTWTKIIPDEAKITISKWFPANVVSSNTHFGIVLTLICVIAIWYIISRTTLGYRLKSVGLNRDAAEYAGINANRCVIVSLAISGALASLAGGLQVLGVNYKINQFAAQESYGFNGITVALIGGCNAFGTLLAGWFFGAMKYAGTRMKVGSDRVPKEVIDIIMGCIVFFIAISGLFRAFFVRRIKGGDMF